jgi:hypothetical protein
LTAQQCEALVVRAHAKGLGRGRVEAFNGAAATEGWNLESRGYDATIVTTGCSRFSRRTPARPSGAVA